MDFRLRGVCYCYQKLTDIKNLSLQFWLVALAIMFFYNGVFPFMADARWVLVWRGPAGLGQFGKVCEAQTLLFVISLGNLCHIWEVVCAEVQVLVFCMYHSGGVCVCVCVSVCLSVCVIISLYGPLGLFMCTLIQCLGFMMFCFWFGFLLLFFFTA